MRRSEAQLDVALLVFGSRGWTDSAAIGAALDILRPRLVVEGECTYGGADVLARREAGKRSIPVWARPVVVRLDGRGKGAPLVRNERMGAELLSLPRPIAGLGFVVGGAGEALTAGSSHMRSFLSAARVPVVVVREGQNSEALAVKLAVLFKLRAP